MLDGLVTISLSSSCEAFIPLSSCDRLEGANLRDCCKGTLKHAMQ